jgi:hypothetical protein
MSIVRIATTVVAFLRLCSVHADDSAADLRSRTLDGMRRAAGYFREHVASHGGYVSIYTEDLSERWGEGEATVDQIWVQPPGTPTVGEAYLAAWRVTDDDYYLQAAQETAQSLVYGQITTGGWTAFIDFDPAGKRVANYRGGRGKGRTTSSLDDGQTAATLLLLMRVDEELQSRDAAIHEATTFGLNALLEAQFPNGAFPQGWDDKPNPKPPVVKARFPKHDWRTEGRIKEYWDMYTLNDNVPGTVLETLLEAHRVYGDERYLDAARKLGDFLILAQMPEPQPGWAQQYNYDMEPIWARKFEPPAVSGDESQETIENLLTLYDATGDAKYLAPIPPALDWLEQSVLDDGQIARFYELEANRPLYMTREYALTYDDSNVPTHYGWKQRSKVDQLTERYQQAVARGGAAPSAPERPPSSRAVERILDALDDDGRWLLVSDGDSTDVPRGERYLSSEVFAENLTTLARSLQPLP